MSWADHFNTYTEACLYYGCDTPDQVRAEMRDDTERAYVEEQDDVEARGAAGPATHYMDEAVRQERIRRDPGFGCPF